MADDDRSRTWDITMIALLLGSVVLVFVYEAIESEPARGVLEFIDLALVIFFIGEWLWRVRRSGARAGGYALRNSWELLGMVPILVPLPSALRLLRLVRLVRILRVFKVLGTHLGFWQRIAKQGHIGKIAIAGGLVTFIGALFVWLLERDDNPALASFPETLWWAIVTVTTVGYGDLTPITPSGRVVASGLMLVGIGTIGLLASTLASAFVMEEHDRDREADDETFAPMPARAGSIAQELNALAGLHQGGKLTDEEYSAAKERVLESRS